MDMVNATKSEIKNLLDVLPSKPGSSRNMVTPCTQNYFEEISDFVEREICKMKMGLSRFGKIADIDDSVSGDGDNNSFNIINYNEDEDELYLPILECSELSSHDSRQRNITTEGKMERIKFLKKAIEINTNMQHLLHSGEYELGLKLELMKEKLAYLKKTNANVPPPAESQQELIKKGAYMKLRIPYFKDEKSFPCPPNKDYLDKIRKDALIVMDIPKIKFWNRMDIFKLEMAVKECIITELKNRIESKCLVLDSKIDKGADDLEVYCKEIEILKKKLDISKTKSVSDILKDYPPDREFDWLRISAARFGKDHSDTECQKFWHLYAKQSINKNGWSKQEDKRLIEIVNKHNRQNWELIARELNTLRSQYQCFIHFQSRLNYRNTLHTGPFTQDEDDKILFLVKTLHKGDYIPWIKIAHHMQTRSPSQIRTRYMCSLNPKYVKGRFTLNEDLFIVSGRIAYGFDFTKLSQLLKTRSPAQIRDRFIRTTGILKTKVGSWSLEEDKRLIELVKIYGEKNWSKISKLICTRSRTQIRQHFDVIKKKNFDIYKIERHTSKYKRVFEEKSKTLMATCNMKAILDNATGGFPLGSAERQHLVTENLTNFLRNRTKKKKKKKKALINREHAQVDRELTEFFIECSTGVSVKKRNLEREFDLLVKQMHAACDYFLVDVSSENIREKIMNSLHMDDLLKRILLKVSEEKEKKNRDTSLSEGRMQGSINYTPNQDACILFHETWLLEKTSALVDNFSELLKAPLMEYSRGLHRDILENILEKNEMIHGGSSIQNGWRNCTENPEIPSVLPPSYMSENSIRTLILSRRKFEQAISHNRDLFDPECFVNPIDNDGDIYRRNCERKSLTSSFVMDMPATHKFQERLLTLYHWPTIMSLCVPPDFVQFQQCLLKRMREMNTPSEPRTDMSRHQESVECDSKHANASQSEEVALGSINGESLSQRKRPAKCASGIKKSKRSSFPYKKRKLKKNKYVNSNDCNADITIKTKDCEAVQQ